jgi:hypothetical protein
MPGPMRALWQRVAHRLEEVIAEAASSYSRRYLDTAEGFGRAAAGTRAADRVGADNIAGPERDRSAAAAAGRGSGGRGGGDEQRAAALAAAKATLAQAQEAEPAISSAVRARVEANGGELRRFETRLKTLESLYRKIQDDMAKYAFDPAGAADNVKDALRYTAVLPDDGYWTAGSRIVEALDAAGFKSVRTGKCWGYGVYKGRNEGFRAPDGMEFEIKFHTKASCEAEDATYYLYEEARRTTSPERAAELDALQAEIYAAVPIPDDVPPDAGYVSWLRRFGD